MWKKTWIFFVISAVLYVFCTVATWRHTELQDLTLHSSLIPNNVFLSNLSSVFAPNGEPIPFYTITPEGHRRCVFNRSPSSANVVVLTVIDNAIHPGLSNFLLSVNKNQYSDVRIINLEWNRTDHNGEDFFARRIAKYDEALGSMDPDTLVVISDSYDVLFVGSERILIDRFFCLGRDVVFSAESLCDTALCRTDPSPMNRLAPARNAYKYLNAGIFMGRARSLKWFFAQTTKILRPDMDDQSAFAQVYLQFPERVVLDHDSLLFGVLPPSLDLLDAHWVIPGVDVLSSNVTLANLDLSLIRRRSSPNTCGFGGPIAFHFAGMRYENNVRQLFNPCQRFLADLYNGIGGGGPVSKRNQRVVVSLTTTPPRIKNLHQTLNSILNQTLTPAAIYLNVPWRSTRLDQVYEIPPSISSLPIIINRCDDFGPASKIIPTLEREQHPDTLIITVDDDMIYPPSLVQELVEFHSRWPNSAFGYAGQVIDIQQGVPPIVRSADNYVNLAAAVDILEAFLGAIYLRSWFDHDEIKQIPTVCWRTDDIWISYNLAKRDIPRIKVKGIARAVLHPNDAIAPLREGNVYALRKNDECAQYLLTGFTRGWTANTESCPVVWKSYTTPPLASFPLRNPFYRETSTSPCSGPVYVPLSPRTHQMFVAQYMSEAGVLSSPSNKYQLNLLPSGQLCVTGPSGSHSICYPGEPQPIGSYYTALQEDGNLCTYKGSSPLNRQGGSIFCSGTSVTHFQLILRIDDDGDFGLFDLIKKTKLWGGKF